MNDFLLNFGTIWDGQFLYDLYEKAYTPWEWHEKLFQVAKDEGLVCFSSPFDKSAVDFLEKLDNPIYKIASFEITDINLIKYVASKNKPIIISTGIATLEDIKLAIESCKNSKNENLALLKCTSSYPAPMEEANLLMINDLRTRFGYTVGLSDHTLGITAPIVAVTQGAKIIEKHFITDKNIGGPDSSFSLNEEEFSSMVKAVREAELSLGEINYNLSKRQLEGKNFSRSLYISQDVKKGTRVTENNVRSVRPGYGLHPKFLPEVLGKKFVKSFTKGQRFKINYIK
jgi:pseudaminic acid synthase